MTDRMTLVGPWAALLAAAAVGCGGQPPDQLGAGGAGSGATSGNTGAASTSHSAAQAIAASAVAADSSSATGGGIAMCDPPVPPGSIYERTMTTYGSDTPATMCSYPGEVLLIVNTAAV